MPQPTYEARRDPVNSGSSNQSISQASETSSRRRVVSQHSNNETYHNTSAALPSATMRSSQQYSQQPQMFRDGGGEKISSRQRVVDNLVGDNRNIPNATEPITYASTKPQPTKSAAAPSAAPSSTVKPRSSGTGKIVTLPSEQQTSMPSPASSAQAGNKSKNLVPKGAKNTEVDRQSALADDGNSPKSSAAQPKSSAQNPATILKSSSSSNAISETLRRKAEQRWADWFISCGIPVPDAEQYARIFVKHRVQKTTLCSLTKDLLYDMGITRIGDVISILRAAKDVSVPDNLATDEHMPNSRSEEWLTSPVGTFATPADAPQPAQRSKRLVGESKHDIAAKNSSMPTNDSRDADDRPQLFIPDAQRTSPNVMLTKQPTSAPISLGKDIIHSVGPQHTSLFVERTAKAAAARSSAATAPRLRFDDSANSIATPKMTLAAKANSSAFNSNTHVSGAAATQKKPITMQPTSNSTLNQRTTAGVLNLTKQLPPASINRTVVGAASPAKIRVSSDGLDENFNAEQARVFPNHQITVKMVPSRELETMQTVSMRMPMMMQEQRGADDKSIPNNKNAAINKSSGIPVPARGRRVIISDELKQQLKQQQQQVPQQQLSLQLQPPAPLTTLPGGMVVGGLYSDQLMMRQYGGGTVNGNMQYVPAAAVPRQQMDLFPKQPALQSNLNFGGGVSLQSLQPQLRQAAATAGNWQQQPVQHLSIASPTKTAVSTSTTGEQSVASVRRPVSERVALPGQSSSSSSAAGGIHRRIGIQTASLSNRRNTDQQKPTAAGVFSTTTGLRSASSLAAEQQKLSNKRKSAQSPSPPPVQNRGHAQRVSASPTKVSSTQPALRTTTNATFADNNTILTATDAKRPKNDAYLSMQMAKPRAADVRSVEFESKQAGRKVPSSDRAVGRQTNIATSSGEAQSSGRSGGRRRGTGGDGSGNNDGTERERDVVRRPEAASEQQPRSIKSRLGNGLGAKTGRADGGEGSSRKTIGKSLRQRLGVKARLG